MTMTDDARSVIRAFSDGPVMTLQAIITLTGLSEHITRFSWSNCDSWKPTTLCRVWCIPKCHRMLNIGSLNGGRRCARLSIHC
ncbi:Uncharacterised protein [Serratia fonticola]|nr:Uncharacterised protein [Serratia fonticola]